MKIRILENKKSLQDRVIEAIERDSADIVMPTKEELDIETEKLRVRVEEMRKHLEEADKDEHKFCRSNN